MARRSHHHQTDHRRSEERHQQVKVDVVADLAESDGGSEQLTHSIASHLHDALVVDLEQIGIEVCLTQHLGQAAIGSSFRTARPNTFQHGDQPVAHRHSDRRRRNVVVQRRQRLGQQLVRAVESSVDGALADPSALGHRLDREAGCPLLDQHVERGGHDGAVGFLAAWSAAGNQCRRRHHQPRSDESPAGVAADVAPSSSSSGASSTFAR